MKVADHSPNALRSPPRERIMKYRTVGWFRTENCDVPLGDEGQAGR